VIIKRQTSIEDTAVELSLPNYIAEFSAMKSQSRGDLLRCAGELAPELKKERRHPSV
jgi:hypothetical protein